MAQSLTHHLYTHNSLINQYVSELRDKSIQTDRMRFRTNLERLGNICAYEISKFLHYESQNIQTPLGTSDMNTLNEQPILATILRAGLPIHNGLLHFFDKADNAFISAYRVHHKDHDFEVKVEYLASPSIEGRTLIISDPMLATGTSLALSYKALLTLGNPSQVHVVTAVASEQGLNYLRNKMPKAHIWLCALDNELTAKSYIVPGLGDAGDLAFGEK